MKLNSRKSFAPALLIAALALIFSAAVFLTAPVGRAQKLKQLGPPPPVPRYKPKPTPTPEYEVVRITSNLVMVPVSATDARGNPVLGLSLSDFRIEEDGRVQELAQIGNPEQVPLDIALLIDVSSSVSERFAFEEQAATRFLRQVLRPNDRATLYAIDKTPRLEQVRTTSEIASAKLLTIKAATGPSPTAFYDTVIDAAHYLASNAPEHHRRVIVAITDGEDNFSNSVRDSSVATYRATQSEDDTTAAGRQRIRSASEAALLAAHRKAQTEVQREVQKANAVFYSINPSGPSIRLNPMSMRAQNAMQELATATAGSAFVPEAITALELVFSRIASELRAQYLLQYYSNNESANRGFRRIIVSTPSRAELRVRTREGYYPKAK